MTAEEKIQEQNVVDVWRDILRVVKRFEVVELVGQGITTNGEIVRLYSDETFTLERVGKGVRIEVEWKRVIKISVLESCATIYIA